MKKAYLSPQLEVLELSNEELLASAVGINNVLSGGNVSRDDEGWSEWA